LYKIIIFWPPATPPETAAGEPAAGAYRHWLVTIAERVVEAASSGVLGFGEQVSESEQDFVRNLTVALND
jgi:hypothetical protein